MSEEEKKAIDYLIFHKYENSSKKEDMIDKVIEIIDKQQKEIEEAHNKLDELENADLTIVYMNGFYDGEKKWKNKIREKIEFYKRYGKVKNSNEYVMCEEIQVFEELLEENKQ